MTEFVGYRLRCPVCNTELFVEVPVGVIAAGRDTDFRPVFDGPDPIAAQMHACPSCRYSGYAVAFEHDAMDADDRELLRSDPPPLHPLQIPDEADLEDLRRWLRTGQLA